MIIRGKAHVMNYVFNFLIGPILALPRLVKVGVVLSVDISLCILSVWFAFYLRLGELIILTDKALMAALISILFAIPIFIISGLYRSIFRYSGWPALLSVARATTVYGLLYASLFTAIGIPGVPRTVGIIQPILLLLFVGSSRALARIWFGDRYQSLLNKTASLRVLIYGAGGSGRQLAHAISGSHEMKLVGFLDDDARLQGHLLNGKPIFNK